MNVNQALILVRQKYLEESQNRVSEETTAQYQQATENFPVVMNLAHELWAKEFMKGLS